MRDDRPSTTAALMALGRALYEEAPDGFSATHDELAESLLPTGMRALAKLARPLWSAAPAVARNAFRAVTFGMSEHVALRTRAIDEAVSDAITRGGARQFVTLGAGLDTRPWRMDALSDVIAYEVDHPATQRYKRARVEGRAPKARELRFVSVDFTKDSLVERLEAAGHNARAKTSWVLEGVTVYLGRAALAQTLDAVAARSGPGSTLSITYVPAAVVSRWSQGKRSIDAVTRAIGERFEGLIERDEIAEALASRGFTVQRDEGTIEMAARYMPAVDPSGVWERERVALAAR
jgi:methyltransferase (TIGR00027 family)